MLYVTVEHCLNPNTACRELIGVMRKLFATGDGQRYRKQSYFKESKFDKGFSGIP